ncbi:hypothetical protein RUND412_006598 [Rhizina undulata]
MDEEDFDDDGAFDGLKEEDYRVLDEAAIKGSQLRQQQQPHNNRGQGQGRGQRYQPQPQQSQTRPYVPQYRPKPYQNQPYKNPRLQAQQQQQQQQPRPQPVQPQWQQPQNQWRPPQPQSQWRPPIQQQQQEEKEIFEQPQPEEDLDPDDDLPSTIPIDYNAQDQVTKNHQSSDYGLDDDDPEFWQSIQVLDEQARAQGILEDVVQPEEHMQNAQVVEQYQEQQEEQIVIEGSEAQEAEYYPDYDSQQEQVLEGNQDPMVLEEPQAVVVPMQGQEYYEQEAEYQDHQQDGQYIDIAQIQAMQAALAELQEERSRLALELKAAQDSLLSKSGEISIVRNNLVKVTREHERSVASLTKLQAEEREKHQQEIEAMKQQSERMRTETLFLRRENQEAVRQNRKLESTQKQQNPIILERRDRNVDSDVTGPSTAAASERSPVTTPKKNKGFALRDGFEDDEIMVSPSKKFRTPTKAGVKRKRSANESPAAVTLPSSMSQPRKTPMVEKPVQIVDELLLERLSLRDNRFEFLNAVIAHRLPRAKERSVETLEKYHFPSSPEKSISSLILEKVTHLQTTANKFEFCAGVCGVILSIWSQCLHEGFCSPLLLILDLFYFAMTWDQANQATTVHKILDETVDLVQRTVDINAIPAVRKKWSLVDKDVDVELCLKILECMALTVVCDDRHARRLWKLTRSDFPLMMLNLNQPLRHIKRMASILCASVLWEPESFGPLVSNELDQRANEGNLLEAASRILVDTPIPPPSQAEKYSREEILALRSEILQLFGAVMNVDCGVLAIVNHRNALPRLVRRIADDLEEVVDLINAAVRLLHSIVSEYPAESAAKLSGATSHKYLVAMTRLAFAENSVMEAGIEEDVIDAAHGMLENMVTPNEAEMLWAMFHP